MYVSCGKLKVDKNERLCHRYSFTVLKPVHTVEIYCRPHLVKFFFINIFRDKCGGRVERDSRPEVWVGGESGHQVSPPAGPDTAEDLGSLLLGVGKDPVANLGLQGAVPVRHPAQPGSEVRGRNSLPTISVWSDQTSLSLSLPATLLGRSLAEWRDSRGLPTCHTTVGFCHPGKTIHQLSSGWLIVSLSYQPISELTNLEAVDIVAPYDALVSGPHSVDPQVSNLELIKDEVRAPPSSLLPLTWSTTPLLCQKYPS